MRFYFMQILIRLICSQRKFPKVIVVRQAFVKCVWMLHGNSCLICSLYSLKRPCMCPSTVKLCTFKCFGLLSVGYIMQVQRNVYCLFIKLNYNILWYIRLIYDRMTGERRESNQNHKAPRTQKPKRLVNLIFSFDSKSYFRSS